MQTPSRRRVTLRLDAELLQRAGRPGLVLNSVVETALRQELARRDREIHGGLERRIAIVLQGLVVDLAEELRLSAASAATISEVGSEERIAR
jgi:hypothetical protein